ncbi:hypothetical protein VE03_06371 [Pseudogymnoascus sp. 23342-1-I1]|nr:hypothetical protein VE03_06371 [Pseudogymnoascus sp. 23342-1-I1]
MSGDSWWKGPGGNETPSRFVKGMTSNWREAPPQNPSTLNPPTQAFGPSNIKFMGSVNAKEFSLGRIACVWTFSEDRMTLKPSEVDRKKEDLLTPNIEGVKGMNVFVKTRKVIVIARFIDHYLALPIYTHKGSGLNSKIEMKSEYVSIHNKPGLEFDPQPETEHGCLYTITTAKEAGNKALAPCTNVWFTAPLTQPYRNMVTFLGKLDAKSLSKLTELYVMATKKALSNTLDDVNQSLWSNARYSLGSEKRQRLAEGKSQQQTSLANMTQPVKQTSSGASWGPAYSGAVAAKTIWGTPTGKTSRNTPGFQPLKRSQSPVNSNEAFGNPAKRARE